MQLKVLKLVFWIFYKYQLAIMDNNWSEKLSQLLNEELRISALSDIKQTFEALPRTEASVVAQRLQLPLIFDCLNASDQ